MYYICSTLNEQHMNLDTIYGHTRTIKTGGFVVTLVWRFDLKRYEVISKVKE